ncbi:MAG: hypothetical protein ACTHJL_04445, partial [Amnibacterium sp.]
MSARDAETHRPEDTAPRSPDPRESEGDARRAGGDEAGATGPAFDEARTAPVEAPGGAPEPAPRRRRRPLVRASDLVRSGLVHQAAALLAVAGFVAALALAAPVVAAVTAAVAVVVPLALSTALRMEDGPWSVGTSVLPRVLLALAIVLAVGSPIAALLCGVLALSALLE